MRVPVIAGNWKMNTTVAEAQGLVTKMRDGLKAVQGVEKVVCPPFVSLTTVVPLLKGTGIGLGAQNMHFENSGAFTGEVSPLMLAGMCEYVIIGHSERRAYFAETDETVNKKAAAALAHGLKPIICVGENLQQNEAGETLAWVKGQVEAALKGLDAAQVSELVIAYEPIWAIGTGKAATSAQAEEVSKHIRSVVAAGWGQGTADKVRIQYGGSVNARNTAEIMAQPDIDGALVGGASLKAEDFISIVKQAAEAKR